MSKATRATAALDRAGVTYSVHAYTYDPDADRIGVQAAESLGVSPGLVLKTLMAVVDGKPVCVIVPSDKEVSMKRLAVACGGRSAQMMRRACLWSPGLVLHPMAGTIGSPEMGDFRGSVRPGWMRPTIST